jgi:hypothetical protein
MTPAWKPKTGTDTDGILDRCPQPCGARGRHSIRYNKHHVECSDGCGMITEGYRLAIDAATEWNKLVRGLK